MKHIATGFLWGFTFAWAGNYVALAFGVSPIVTALAATTLGVAIATRPYVGAWRVASAAPSKHPAAESPARS